MGFPVGYTELILTKIIFYTRSLLGLLKTLISILFSNIGLAQFLQHDPSHHNTRTDCSTELNSLSTVLIRELLPVVKFSDLINPPESCAVCLFEFDCCDEIRRLMNCRHVFHRKCLDTWMDLDQKTCPLCRSRVVPDDMLQDGFNERLWAASGISDFYEGY